MIQGVLTTGALPVLERLVQFTARRHEVLTDNIANLSTPYFKPRDLDPATFQAALREAIDTRRRRPNPTSGLLPADRTELPLPGAAEGGHHQGILFHDQNNRDLERIMQSLAENTMVHNATVQMIRNQFDMLRMAIRERL